jgi:hypothetical protein
MQEKSEMPTEGDAKDHPRSESSQGSKFATVAVGVVAMLSAAFGLLYNGVTIHLALRGSFSELIAQHGLRHFHAAFYVMSAICILCYLFLLAIGIDLLRARLRCTWFLTAVLVFEMLYFLALKFAPRGEEAGLSIAAATGVANGGLMAQFVILFPVWAPLVLFWARRKATRPPVAPGS